jgi:hypothetical protein
MERITLDCAPVGHGAVRVKWRYRNPNDGDALVTVGTLHLSGGRFREVVRFLEAGGAPLKLTGHSAPLTTSDTRCPR